MNPHVTFEPPFCSRQEVHLQRSTVTSGWWPAGPPRGSEGCLVCDAPPPPLAGWLTPPVISKLTFVNKLFQSGGRHLFHCSTRFGSKQKIWLPTSKFNFYKVSCLSQSTIYRKTAQLTQRTLWENKTNSNYELKLRLTRGTKLFSVNSPPCAKNKSFFVPCGQTEPRRRLREKLWVKPAFGLQSKSFLKTSCCKPLCFWNETFGWVSLIGWGEEPKHLE